MSHYVFCRHVPNDLNASPSGFTSLKCPLLSNNAKLDTTTLSYASLWDNRKLLWLHYDNAEEDGTPVYTSIENMLSQIVLFPFGFLKIHSLFLMESIHSSYRRFGHFLPLLHQACMTYILATLVHYTSWSILFINA